MAIINGEYKEYKLANGLVVALQKTPTQTIAAKLRVNYGTAHERDGEEGMAHFLEHCVASAGSFKYDPITADKIRGRFGFSNAYTNIGRTSFVGQMLCEDIGTWFDYISDIVFRPRFNQDRVNAEKERVLREISDAKSSPNYPIKVQFNRAFYRSHPKGRFVLGKEKVIRNANLEIISNFHKRGYHPNNMDLIIVGGLPVNIETLIEGCFGNIDSGENTRRTFPKLKPLNTKKLFYKPAPERINASNPDESSAEISLWCLGPANEHPDEYSVIVMNQLLGGDTSSLLFRNMSLNKGLVYRVSSSMDGSYNVGELGISALVPARRIYESFDEIFKCIKKMKSEKPGNISLDRIKRNAKYYFAKTFETNEGHIDAIECKLDRGLTPEMVIAKWDEVTPDKVLEVANKYLPDKDNGNYILVIRDPLKA